VVASGTGAILSIARAIARHDITFKSNVQLIAFVSLRPTELLSSTLTSYRQAGEEQGLWGSRSYARELYP
jgi:hypothetical protein